VVIVPMPANLAVLGANRARAVQDAFPEVGRWAVGGHSLGGSMAARYARRFPDAVQGLVLWASYPAAGDDLSTRALAVASIYGTRDSLATVDEVETSRALLPADTVWTPIEGGNHAQFGRYGPQPRDGEATISHEDQQAQIVAATLALLDRMGDQVQTDKFCRVFFRGRGTGTAQRIGLLRLALSAGTSGCNDPTRFLWLYLGTGDERSAGLDHVVQSKVSRPGHVSTSDKKKDGGYITCSGDKSRCSSSLGSKSRSSSVGCSLRR
jgi:hypothetical protein